MGEALVRGRRAADEHDFEAAVAELEAGLADGPGPSLRTDLLLALAEVLARKGDRTRSRRTYAAAAAEAAGLEDWPRHAEAALGYAGPIEATLDQEPAAVLLERSLAELPRHDPLWPRAAARLAVVLGNLELAGRVTGLIADALDAARDCGDDAAELFVLRAKQFLVGGNPREAADSARALVAAAERSADRQQVGFAYGWLTGSLFNLGDLDAAGAALARVEQAAVWGSDAFHGDTARMWRSTLALVAGRLPEAERLVDAATLHRESHGTERQMRTLLLLPIRAEQDRLEELAADVERDLTEATAVTWHPFGAYLAARVGDLEGSRRIISALLARDGDVLPRDGHRFSALAVLARAALLVGHDGVEVLYELLAPFQGLACSTSGFSWFGLVDRHLGALAASLGRRDAACLHYDAAIVTAEARRLAVEEGWCRLELGELLLGDESTRRDGVRQILATIDIGRSHDLTRLTRQAVEALGGPAPSAPDSWLRLSAGEVDVARLVAEGFSNQEIAAALHRSPLTIETQVKRIFSKLGLRSRAALASEFVRRTARPRLP